MISVSWKPRFNISYLNKYPKSFNNAALSVANEIYNLVQKKYTRISDGNAGNGGRRAEPRTTWPGVRRRTGTLARAVKVGLNRGSGYETLNARTISDDKLIKEVVVGVSENIQYAVIQEREGKKQSGRKGSRNFYPFIQPAFDELKPKLQSIFDNFMRRAK